MNRVRFDSAFSRLLCTAAAALGAVVFAPALHAQYCPAGAQRCNSAIPQITRVQVATLDHQELPVTGSGTNNSTQCYSDFTAGIADVFQGQSYPITITNPSTFTGVQASVWSDWNQDFLFGTPASGEQSDLIWLGAPTQTFTGTLFVPGNATLGPTRMRVRVAFNSAYSSCGEPAGTGADTNMGMVWDFTVNVLASNTGACCNALGACSFATSGDCAAAGGTFQSLAAPCSPNPCGGACCNVSGTCIVSTLANCNCTDTTCRYIPGGLCTVGSCNGVCCDAVTGACTLPPNGSNTCVCGAAWQGYASVCGTAPCAIGACCTTTGACTLAAPFGCSASSVFKGQGTTCTPTNACTVPAASSACCNLVTGACTVAVNPVGCQTGSQSLTFMGFGTTCAPTNPCGVACCNTTTGACTAALSSSACGAGTTFLSTASCTPNPCPIGACCSTTAGTCSSTASAGCTSPSVFQGAGSTCTPTNPCGGACCNTTTRACTVVLNSGACSTGTFTASAVCSPDSCPQGVCCTTASGACAVKAAAGCTSGTQTFVLGGVCAPSPCGQTGSCCNTASGACTTTTSGGCAGVGSWTNSGSCTPTPCSTGACCNTTSGACTVTAPGGCTSAPANSYQGVGSTCSPFTPCGGACCNATSGACTITLSSVACGGANNFIANTTCSPYPCGANVCCNNTTGACTAAAAAGCAAGTTQIAGTVCNSVPAPCGQGACCNSTTGACTATVAAGCVTAPANNFQGGGTSCGPNPCFTGACCLFDGTCSVTTYLSCSGTFGSTYMGGNSTCVAGQQCFSETEPNDSIGTANGPFTLNNGDSIVGVGSGTVNILSPATTDRFRVQPAAASAAIYRHRLALVTVAGVSGTNSEACNIRGGNTQFDNVISAGGADTTLVPSSTTGTIWYEFGGSVPVDLVIGGGTANFTEAYRFTMSTTTVTPFDAGSMPGGLITVSSVGMTAANTDLWVFDSSFNAIPGFGNDDLFDASGHFVLQSQATKELLTPGVYYVAISDSNLAVNQTSPLGDRNPNLAVFLQPGAVATGSSTAVPLDLSFKIIDGAGVAHPISGATAGSPARKTVLGDVIWVKFTLTAPATGACCQASGACVVASQNGCTQAPTPPGGLPIAGTYGGDGSSCGGGCAQPPVGACCQFDGSCTVGNAYTCSTYTGAFGGGASTCGGTICDRSLAAADPTLSGGTSGVFVDITASGGTDLLITRFDYYCTQAWNNTNLPLMDVYVRQGSFVGAEFGDCAAQSPPPFGWVLNTEKVTSPYPVGGSTTPIPLTLSSPVVVHANQTVGFYFVARAGGIKAAITSGIGAATFANSDLTLYSDRTRPTHATDPFWTNALTTGQNSFTGRVYYRSVSGVCCRGSTCNSSISSNACVGNTLAGATYPLVGTCNAGGSTTTPCCYADYNKIGGISVQDIFDFLNDWFAGSKFSIVGGDGNTGTLNVQNIFDFLNAWFAGGC